VRDIVEEFEYLIPPGPAAAGSLAEPPAAPGFVFSGEEGRIVEALSEGELDVDSLSRRAAVPVAKLGAVLIGLEMKRIVRMLPGRRAVLTVTLPRKEIERE